MTVLDLIKKIDTFSLTKEMIYLLPDDIPVDLIEQNIKDIFDEIKQIKTMEVIENSCELAFISSSMNDDGLDCYLIKSDEIPKVKNAFSVLKPMDFNNPLYGLTMVERNEILSMSINIKNIEKYGIVKSAAEFLNACFTFSISNDERSKILHNIEESLLKQSQEIIDGTAKFYTIEEVFEELEDKYGFKPTEQTPEEKEEEMRMLKEKIDKWFFTLKDDVLSIINEEV